MTGLVLLMGQLQALLASRSAGLYLGKVCLTGRGSLVGNLSIMCHNGMACTALHGRYH